MNSHSIVFRFPVRKRKRCLTVKPPSVCVSAPLFLGLSVSLSVPIAHPHPHTPTHTPMHTHTHAHTHAHPCTRARAHAYPQAHTRTRTHTHARTTTKRTHTHTLAHTCTHTRAHTLTTAAIAVGCRLMSTASPHRRGHQHSDGGRAVEVHLAAPRRAACPTVGSCCLLCCGEQR